MTADDKFLVLGSDGVWDHMSNEAVVELASKHVNNLQQGAFAVTTAARQRWLEEGEGYIDDITAVIVRL